MACFVFLPKFCVCWNPNALSNGIRWSLCSGFRHEGTAFMNGISAFFMKEAPTLPLQPWEDTERQSVRSLLSRRGKRALTPTRLAPCFRLPGSRLWAINFCCLQATKSTVFCYSSPNRPRHQPILMNTAELVSHFNNKKPELGANWNWK